MFNIVIQKTHNTDSHKNAKYSFNLNMYQINVKL